MPDGPRCNWDYCQEDVGVCWGPVEAVDWEDFAYQDGTVYACEGHRDLWRGGDYKAVR